LILFITDRKTIKGCKGKDSDIFDEMAAMPYSILLEFSYSERLKVVNTAIINLSCGRSSFCCKIMVLAVLFFVAVGHGSSIDWTAYNDCAGSTSSNPNTTEFTDYDAYSGSTSGQLVDDATGSTAGMPAAHPESS